MAFRLNDDNFLPFPTAHGESSAAILRCRPRENSLAKWGRTFVRLPHAGLGQTYVPKSRCVSLCLSVVLLSANRPLQLGYRQYRFANACVSGLRAGRWLVGRNEGPAIGVPGGRTCRQRMNSGVSTSPGLLETEELVEGLEEWGLGGDHE